MGLAALGLFPGPPTILFPAPVVTPGLLARQAEVRAALPEHALHPHYRPGCWVPRVTLSGPLKHPAAALTALLPLWRPLAGSLVCIELVRFRPVEILAGHMLEQCD